jgi:hypothetical protein
MLSRFGYKIALIHQRMKIYQRMRSAIMAIVMSKKNTNKKIRQALSVDRAAFASIET